MPMQSCPKDNSIFKGDKAIIHLECIRLPWDLKENDTLMSTRRHTHQNEIRLQIYEKI